MKTGIYKITSPTYKIYIGQSKDLRRRKSEYKNNDVKLRSQTRLYNSLQKYGFENHQFDIIEYCSERFWQDEFDVTGENGLNCLLQECGAKRRVFSNEFRQKKSENMTGENNPMFGVERPAEWRLFMSELMKERFKDKTNHPMYGKPMPEKQKEALLKSRLGSKASDETKKKMSASHKGMVIGEEGRKNISSGKLGDKNPMFGKFGKLNNNSKIIINTINSEIIYGVGELSRLTGISRCYLKDMLNGYRINNTPYLFLNCINNMENIFITDKTKEEVFSPEDLEFISNSTYTNIRKRGNEFLIKYLLYCNHKFLKM